ncbi:CocE/NonD family hydrolase [Komagataeibacter rhaeticus]|nr:CocE/NonD family hydrolase [Komagataeibacter rhaeticus]
MFHLEFMNIGGQITCSGLPVIRFTTQERLDEIIALFRAHGVNVANPHVYTLEEGSPHQKIPPALLEAKKRNDPLGLLNPGKMRSFVPDRPWCAGMTDTALHAVAPPRTGRMRTRDGTTLVADIWQPEGDGPFPVLLMRQAYGRHIGTSLCYAPPEWYAARGYIVVMQDARGRGESGGAFDLFRHEAQDGVDTVNWAAGLPGSSGLVGMFGFSFQGTNQLLAATQHCPALRALAPAMIGWDLRHDWAYENGAFPLRANLGWAIQLAAETARLAGDHAAQATLFAASRALSFSGPAPVRPPVLDLLRRYSHYTTWLDTPAEDPYWATISPAAHLDAIIANKPAVFLIGGWCMTVTCQARWRRGARCRAMFRPGCWWGHGALPMGPACGDVDFGNDAITDIDQQQVRWFDHWLKNRPLPCPMPPCACSTWGRMHGVTVRTCLAPGHVPSVRHGAGRH